MISTRRGRSAFFQDSWKKRWVACSNPSRSIFFLEKINRSNKFNYPTANCIRKKPFKTRHVKSSMRQFLSLYKVCCALVMITLSVVLSLASEFKFKKKFKLDPLNGTSYRMSLFTWVHKITSINNAHTYTCIYVLQGQLIT